MASKNLATPNDITAEWLTSALHDFKSLCSDIKITKLTKSDVEGNYTSTIIQRLGVKYSSDTNCPNTFILKFVTPHKEDSSIEKELYFYKNIDSFGLSIFRAPKPYLALKCGDSYVFILEDLSSMKHTPKKEGGADYETAQRIVMALACFHAKFWDDSDNALDTLRKKYCPVAEHDSYWESIQETMEHSMTDFTSVVRDKEVQTATKFCAEHLSELVKLSRKSPCTLLHGDASLSNYFLEGERSVVAVDWQGLDVGSGPGELAYFLSMSVQEDVRKKHETEFLHLYHDMLAKKGVDTDKFTFDQCYHRYLLGVATSSLVPVRKAREFIEGRKVLEMRRPSNPEMAEKAKAKIAVHDNVKPMIDLWCTTAHNHPITSLHLEQ